MTGAILTSEQDVTIRALCQIQEAALRVASFPSLGVIK